jgi:hypothetical protein
MKATRKSSLLAILSSPLALVTILVFLTFIPLGNVYGDTKDNLPIPNATKSWQFSSQAQNSITVDNTRIENKTNITSLNLVGGGYLTTKDPSTRNLSALTLSAWIKPSYIQGSPVFTIISRENQFALSINNIIPPTRTAVFSIFDGMKWQTVSSSTPIGESWTHVAATFNGTVISIYINGTLQSTFAITGTPTISDTGELTTKTVDQISSNADIVIGAYLNSLRGKISNEFSGSIESVNLYDSVLEKSQIVNLYDNSIFSSKIGAAIKPIQDMSNSSINSNLAISDNITSMKRSTNSTNNPAVSDQINFLDIITTNSTINANWITPAYFIPLETPLNSTIYSSNAIPDHESSPKIFVNDTSLLKGTSLINSTTRH